MTIKKLTEDEIEPAIMLMGIFLLNVMGIAFGIF